MTGSRQAFLKNERGGIMIMFAAVMVLVLMAAAAAVDFARYALAGEKLQTAVDSASLAAAKTGSRYVRIRIYLGERYVTCYPGVCCSSCGTKTVSGREEDLIARGGWKRYIDDRVRRSCTCGAQGYSILDRWVEYPENGDTVNMARIFFNLNKPAEMDGNMGESLIEEINVFNDRNDPRYPSVAVRARGSMKTVWMNFMNKLNPSVDLSRLNAGRCGQSETFYLELNGRYTKVVQDACE